MRAWEQEHFALLDADVAEDPIVDDAEQHSASVLEEPLLEK
jgi:hypothetical protein